MIKIDRCVCFNKTFAELLLVAQEKQCSTLEQVRAHVEFGTSCGLCNLYVERSLETQEVVFDEVIDL